MLVLVKKKNQFSFMCVSGLPAFTSVPHRGQEPVLDPLELQSVVCHLWGLGISLESSGRAASAF